MKTFIAVATLLALTFSGSFARSVSMLSHKGAVSAITDAQGQLGILSAKANDVSDKIKEAYNNVHAVNQLVNGNVVKTVGSFLGFSLYNRKLAGENKHTASFQSFADALDQTDTSLEDAEGLSKKLAGYAEKASKLINGINDLF